MNTGPKKRISVAPGIALAVSFIAFAGVGLSAAQAQSAPVVPPRHHARLVATAAARPLTVHRHIHTAIVTDDGIYDETGLLRRWDDPRLYTFYGWRLGGDNFYGDQAGDPITRGNATLGMIAGYGPANGGYGGPHFDSVGGFHNGPGPDAQEAADYASGSISRPDLEGPPPVYPSLKQQVSDLNTGLAGTGQVTRHASTHQMWAQAYRTSSGSRRGAMPPDEIGSF